ncbi:hypothetical protein AJ78_00045 [Emergomyces pasteurianus Ep9510]|uniref:Early meiotic induction protein 1 n=1 Tax=Emergomyces pasteurianus Ep9510 TaxID=1447872 RepID=A0A1J9QXI0_9EURO|nr:hypothetical protein AJ78_00045 [Emergomyces pasteurianus Ep9510]
MGWWWSSAPSQGEASPQSHTSQSLPNHTDAPKQTLQAHANLASRDELAEAEFQSLLNSFQDGNNAPKSPYPSPSTPQSASQPTIPQSTVTLSPTSDNDSTEATANISPETLYPTTMSCRSAFDYAFFCQSFGGQWVNVYRYGELRSCSEHWSDFWFCMRTRSYSDEEKAKMISDRYRKKAVKYKTGPSSEDVWDVRTEPVRGAFQGDFKSLEREMMKAAAEREKGKEGA